MNTDVHADGVEVGDQLAGGVALSWCAGVGLQNSVQVGSSGFGEQVRPLVVFVDDAAEHRVTVGDF